MLIDEVEIKVKAGDGGPGSVSFKRAVKGGPDGGNGGDGGDIYFQGFDDITLLQQFQYKKTIEAESGIPGKGNNLYGKNGPELIVKVPLGTKITNLDTKEEFEIISANDKILVAKGGIGGKGNNSFKTATNQAPRFAESGTKGEEKSLRLVLGLIADVGLIGLPNAGKSSILETITNANPKIGNYAFTTLEPNLGVMENMVIADIPGLIEGASGGKGLGFNFLKHIQKTKFIIHCVSLENENLKTAYETVNSEMSKFDDTLVKRARLILLTKKDLFSEKELKLKVKELKVPGIKIKTFSILDDNDIQYLKEKIKDIYSDENAQPSS